MARLPGSRTAGSYRPETAYDCQRQFLSAIILSAIQIAKGERAASDLEVERCRQFLCCQKCADWLALLGINVD